MMGRGLNRRGVAASAIAGAIVGVVLLAPSAAFADSCNGPSAVNIYSECIPTAGGGSHQGGRHHKSGGTTHTTTPPATTPSYTTTTTPAAPLPVTKKANKTLAHAGHDKTLLKKLLTDQSLGATRAVEAASFRTKPPSALGAVFDLGSGPTALFSFLAGVAIVLLGGGGLRLWRRRQN